jgi:hypothetical protein
MMRTEDSAHATMPPETSRIRALDKIRRQTEPMLFANIKRRLCWAISMAPEPA